MLNLKQKFQILFPALTERTTRLVAAAEAMSLERGGITEVAEAAGISRATVHAGIKELKAGTVLSDAKKSRRKGGGRKCITEKVPGLVEELEKLIDPFTRGDPESPLLWVAKSLRTLASELGKLGFKVSYKTIRELLIKMEYSLQGNKKVIEGGKHPDRNAQFENINSQVKELLSNNNPVISVDAKKKELVGLYKNAGKEYRPKGSPEEVKVYDFVDKKLGKANPYGVYDVGNNVGWVSVGTDHDTASFAVDTIRRWWNVMGKEKYPNASELMIVADGGGSNSTRARLWKKELQSLADEINFPIRVSHLPPGTSKWNKIEHKMFSYISMNWRGRPLVSHEIILNLISNTTTKTGLKIKAELNDKLYKIGTKVTDSEFKAINLVRDNFHGEWNYKISPRAA